MRNKPKQIKAMDPKTTIIIAAFVFLVIIGVLVIITLRVGSKNAKKHGGRYMTINDYMRGRETLVIANLQKDTELLLMHDEELAGFMIYPVIRKSHDN